MYTWLTVAGGDDDGFLVPSSPPLASDVATALASVLKGARDRSGLTQELVAHQAGLSRNYYQLLEHCLTDRHKRTPANPTLATLGAICGVLDMSVTDLVVAVYGPPSIPPMEYRPDA